MPLEILLYHLDWEMAGGMSAEEMDTEDRRCWARHANQKKSIERVSTRKRKTLQSLVIRHNTSNSNKVNSLSLLLSRMFMG